MSDKLLHPNLISASPSSPATIAFDTFFSASSTFHLYSLQRLTLPCHPLAIQASSIGLSQHTRFLPDHHTFIDRVGIANRFVRIAFGLSSRSHHLSQTHSKLANFLTLSISFYHPVGFQWHLPGQATFPCPTSSTARLSQYSRQPHFSEQIKPDSWLLPVFNALFQTPRR